MCRGSGFAGRRLRRPVGCGSRRRGCCGAAGRAGGIHPVEEFLDRQSTRGVAGQFSSGGFTEYLIRWRAELAANQIAAFLGRAFPELVVAAHSCSFGLLGTGLYLRPVEKHVGRAGALTMILAQPGCALLPDRSSAVVLVFEFASVEQRLLGQVFPLVVAIRRNA